MSQYGFDVVPMQPPYIPLSPGYANPMNPMSRVGGIPLTGDPFIDGMNASMASFGSNGSFVVLFLMTMSYITAEKLFYDVYIPYRYGVKGKDLEVAVDKTDEKKTALACVKTFENLLKIQERANVARMQPEVQDAIVKMLSASSIGEWLQKRSALDQVFASNGQNYAIDKIINKGRAFIGTAPYYLVQPRVQIDGMSQEKDQIILVSDAEIETSLLNSALGITEIGTIGDIDFDKLYEAGKYRAFSKFAKADVMARIAEFGKNNLGNNPKEFQFDRLRQTLLQDAANSGMFGTLDRQDSLDAVDSAVLDGVSGDTTGMTPQDTILHHLAAHFGCRYAEDGSLLDPEVVKTKVSAKLRELRDSGKVSEISKALQHGFDSRLRNQAMAVASSISTAYNHVVAKRAEGAPDVQDHEEALRLLVHELAPDLPKTYLDFSKPGGFPTANLAEHVFKKLKDEVQVGNPLPSLVDELSETRKQSFVEDTILKLHDHEDQPSETPVSIISDALTELHGKDSLLSERQKLGFIDFMSAARHASENNRSTLGNSDFDQDAVISAEFAASTSAEITVLRQAAALRLVHDAMKTSGKTVQPETARALLQALGHHPGNEDSVDETFTALAASELESAGFGTTTEIREQLQKALAETSVSLKEPEKRQKTLALGCEYAYQLLDEVNPKKTGGLSGAGRAVVDDEEAALLALIEAGELPTPAEELRVVNAIRGHAPEVWKNLTASRLSNKLQNLSEMQLGLNLVTATKTELAEYIGDQTEKFAIVRNQKYLENQLPEIQERLIGATSMLESRLASLRMVMFNDKNSVSSRIQEAASRNQLTASECVQDAWREYQQLNVVAVEMSKLAEHSAGRSKAYAKSMAKLDLEIETRLKKEYNINGDVFTLKELLAGVVEPMMLRVQEETFKAQTVLKERAQALNRAGRISDHDMRAFAEAGYLHDEVIAKVSAVHVQFLRDQVQQLSKTVTELEDELRNSSDKNFETEADLRERHSRLLQAIEAFNTTGSLTPDLRRELLLATADSTRLADTSVVKEHFSALVDNVTSLQTPIEIDKDLLDFNAALAQHGVTSVGGLMVNSEIQKSLFERAKNHTFKLFNKWTHVNNGVNDPEYKRDIKNAVFSGAMKELSGVLSIVCNAKTGDEARMLAPVANVQLAIGAYESHAGSMKRPLGQEPSRQDAISENAALERTSAKGRVRGMVR